ncbi:hypothetical protein MMC20_004642 [Loxospora ochrophaea]|nr:hypothetical protein [Loxospora ochrophaea]
MAPLSLHLENAIGTLLSPVRAHDARLLTRQTAFAQLAPTLSVMGPDSESAGNPPHAVLDAVYTQVGANRFPTLRWTLPEAPPAGGAASTPEAKRVTHWLVMVEDADAPLPQPVVHGVYYDIAREKTMLEHADLTPAAGTEAAAAAGESRGRLHGGFRYGANRRGTVWSGPRPVMGHGRHRYFFQVAGLSEALGVADGLAQGRGVGKQEVLDALRGGEKVVCWGEWVGTFERKLG